MRTETGVADVDPESGAALGQRPGAPCVCLHAKCKMGKAQGDSAGDVGIHGRPEDHKRPDVQVHQAADECAAGAHRSADQIGCAADELRQTVYHDIGAEPGGAENQRRESVVHDQRYAGTLCHLGQARDVRDTQGRVGDTFHVNQPGSIADRGCHRIDVTGVHESRVDTGLQRQKVVEQCPGAAVDRIAGDDVVPGVTEGRDHRRDGPHTAGAAVGRLRSLQGGQLTAQAVYRRVEVATVQIATSGLRAFSAGEDIRHGRGVDHGKCRTGLHAHVDAAVLTELMAKICKSLDRIVVLH